MKMADSLGGNPPSSILYPYIFDYRSVCIGLHLWFHFPGLRIWRHPLFCMNDAANSSKLAALEAGTAPDAEAPDDILAAAAGAGDEAAFEQLFARHRRMVARLAARFFYRREEIEEIIQESFAAAYFALPSYQGGREHSFTAWLSRITVRACYNQMRRARGRSETSLTEEEALRLKEALRDESLESDVEGALISRDLASKLLARLGPDERLVLLLLNIAELSVAEIAELTGWSISKVKMRAHRARNALRRVLHRFI
jgi:RNA polymerase sigma-70 factor (ECF subfamily)